MWTAQRIKRILIFHMSYRTLNAAAQNRFITLTSKFKIFNLYFKQNHIKSKTIWKRNHTDTKKTRLTQFKLLQRKLYKINNCEQFVRTHGTTVHVTFTVLLPFYVFIQSLQTVLLGRTHSSLLCDKQHTVCHTTNTAV